MAFANTRDPVALPPVRLIGWIDLHHNFRYNNQQTPFVNSVDTMYARKVRPMRLSNVTPRQVNLRQVQTITTPMHRICNMAGVKCPPRIASGTNPKYTTPSRNM